MKVLFIHNTVPEYRIVFFQELSKLVDLEILVTQPELSSQIYDLSMSIPSDLRIKYVNRGCTIDDIIASKKFDLVVLPPVDNFTQVKFAYKALSICKKKNIRVAYWTEKWEAEKRFQPVKKRLKNWVQAKFIMYFAHRADICIAAGSKSKQYYLEHGITEDKIKIAVDSSTSPRITKSIDIRRQYNILNEGKVILYLGRLVKRKGCEILLRAFEEVLNKYNNVHLLICGDGEEYCYLKSLARNNDKIIFAGKIEPHVRADFFKQSNVFVLPSYSLGGVIEAWGLTVNEALEQGTPVVATTAVGSAFDLADEECCVMVNEHDPNALANGISNILAKDDITKQCLNLYHKYSVRNMAEQFYEAFCCILKSE